MCSDLIPTESHMAVANDCNELIYLYSLMNDTTGYTGVRKFWLGCADLEGEGLFTCGDKTSFWNTSAKSGHGYWRKYTSYRIRNRFT